ncbi:MAG: 3-dehydroquinate synthase, partial [Gammaproteobacteria bacterium]
MALMHSLNVDLGDRSYPIYIGDNLLGEASLLGRHLRGHSALIVSNTTLASLYLRKVQQSLDARNIRHDSLILD